MNENNILLVLCRKRRDGQAALKRRVELRIIFNDEGLPALRPVKQKPSPGGAEVGSPAPLSDRLDPRPISAHPAWRARARQDRSQPPCSGPPEPARARSK